MLGLPSNAPKNHVSCTGWTGQQSDQENRPHMVYKWIWFVPLAFENVSSTSGDFRVWSTGGRLVDVDSCR